MEIMILIYISLFVFGAIIASFLNALMYRLDNEMPSPDIYTKRSHCESCGKVLTWYELFPIVWYFISRGQCTKCKKPVFWYYPLSEALLGLFFILLFVSGASYWVYLATLIMFSLSYFDVTSKSIPASITNSLIGLGVLSVVVESIVVGQITIPGGIWIGLGIAVLTVVLNKFKKSFGVGDILVFIGLSFFLTMSEMVILYFLSAIVAVLFVLPLIVSDKKWLKKYIPYVPFIMVAFVLTIAFSDTLMDWFTLSYLL